MDTKSKKRRLAQSLQRVRCQRKCLTGLMELRRRRAEQQLFTPLEAGGKETDAEFEYKCARTLACIDRLEEKLNLMSQSLVKRQKTKQEPKREVDTRDHFMRLLFGREKGRLAWDRFATFRLDDPCTSVPPSFWILPPEQDSSWSEEVVPVTL
ncbi:DNA repair protein rad-5 [Trichuris trichiura]|uniref:DNA repair protein rad-5 n=1 Tax=Trichuris trichiura TaxID=36087 RepID=A0A077ZED8_TRITR|nr:DNA repair protein rad-5 [Trichuris trichiura]